MNKKNEYKMAWIKARNPYTTSEIIDDTEHYSKDQEPIEDEEDIETEELISKKQADALFTPLGIIVLDEYTDTYKIFNFWICHTNFNLTKGIKEVIKNTEGVEILHIFTRYRFRIAVAKYWKAAEVFRKIKENVTKYMDNRQKLIKRALKLQKIKAKALKNE